VTGMAVSTDCGLLDGHGRPGAFGFGDAPFLVLLPDSRNPGGLRSGRNGKPVGRTGYGWYAFCEPRPESAP
jgi:hypothetical protein